MEQKHYTVEKAQQILIALLKAHGIKRIIASPGTTNITFVASLQQDPFFEIYSSVDERSAAYMACGMAAETGEPVVITCTGATASRNYMPGLTEAYYKKLPVLAVTANTGPHNIHQLVPQQLDRSSIPNDIAKLSVDLPVVKSDTDYNFCNFQVNKAILELSRNGGGPVHINLATTYSRDFSVEELPSQRVINRISILDGFPSLENKKVGIFIGSHKDFSKEETELIDYFCKCHNAVVFCDHTSGYYGEFRVQYSLVMMQSAPTATKEMDVLIHLGEVSGDYPSMGLKCKEVWRVNEDGELRDTFHHLRYVFDMPESIFFKTLNRNAKPVDNTYVEECISTYRHMYDMIPDSLPFGNIWIAKMLCNELPKSSELHLGILNTLRSWNMFNIRGGVRSYCNVGGFGIDGVMSTTIGASLANTDKLYFCIIGDLAFFYDLNSIANRHLGKNLRLLLINNGRGTEFRNYLHMGHDFGEDADPFIAAAGHYGNKSSKLVRHFAEDLGFKYLTASNKEEFLNVYQEYVSPRATDKPILFEVFTDTQDESDALEIMCKLCQCEEPISRKQVVKNVVKTVVGQSITSKIRNIIR